MPGLVRRLVLRSLWIGNAVVVLLFLLACLTPYLSPSRTWITGFLGLIFPFLFLLVLAYLLFWILVKPAWGWISMLALLIGWRNIRTALPLRVQGIYASTLQDTARQNRDVLRVMTWNVRRFTPPAKDWFDPETDFPQQSLLQAIRLQSPDIICFQEFSTAVDGVHADNIRFFTGRMGYPHYAFAKDRTTAKKFHSGTAIFSRLPIVHVEKIRFPEEWRTGTESLIFVDVVVGADTMRVFTAHLQSYGFMRRDYLDLARIKKQEDTGLVASKNIFDKMRAAFELRGRQSEFVRTQLDRSPYPVILGADLNDVPNSYAYFKVRGNRKDAFLEEGYGFGKTYRGGKSGLMRYIPTLRIDYILVSRELEVTRFHRLDAGASDHYGLVADMLLREK